MKRPTFVGIAAACLCLGHAPPLLAAEAPGTGAAPASASDTEISGQPSPKTCLSDLRAFDSQLEKDGYWPGGSGYGFGYPKGSLPGTADTSTGYLSARPGYEVRALIASANILARNGQQKLCEDVLAAASEDYKRYIADMRGRKVPPAATLNWQNPLLETAVPDRLFRSDELIDVVVRSLGNVNLGSIDDIVMNPKTGKIAYLVVARGGIFGIDEKYVPVPWGDFKVMPNVDLLVLDTTKDVMDAAPQVKHDQFGAAGHFDQESQKIDDYWKAHPASNGNN